MSELLHLISVNKLVQPKPLSVLDHGLIKLIDYMGSDQVESLAISICDAARVSIEGGKRGENKTAADDEKLLNYLAKNLHTSPFEQCEVVLYIKCPLFVRSQWHRHRTFSYNEVSGRYSTTIFNEFYTPEVSRLMTVGSPDSRQGGIAMDTQSGAIIAQNQMHQLCSRLFLDYQDLLKMGMAPELARLILPQATYTEFYAKANLLNYCKFLHLRLDSHAQWEMREYAKGVFNILSELWPIAMRVMNLHLIKYMEN